MKTSNKILLGLIVIVFSVPFLLALSLKSKMQRREYTIVKDDNIQDSRRPVMHAGSFTKFKVVQVMAPNPNVLTCHFKLSDKMNYEYYQADSMMVFNSNDTLYIKYLADTKSNGDRVLFPATIKVNLPSFDNLIVDGAVVVIDSFPASLNNISVKLKNHGEIKDRTKQTNQEQEHAQASPTDSKKDNEALQASATLIDEATSHRHNDVKSETYKRISLPMPDFKLNDLLIFRLLL